VNNLRKCYLLKNECCVRLFSTSVSRLSCTVKIEQINGKIVCLTDNIIRVILYTVHSIHQKDNINMDFREMECEDIKWIQLMQPSSLVNMVLNVSVAWEHKTIILLVLCQKIMEAEGISIVPNLCVWSPEKLYQFCHIERLIFYHRSVLL
jgi:hypothetical protein